MGVTGIFGGMGKNDKVCRYTVIYLKVTSKKIAPEVSIIHSSY